MLDSATIRRPGLVNGNVDVGRILECMLYYGRVHLVLDGQFFVGLASVLGMDRLETLLRHPRVTSELAPSFPAVHSERSGAIQTHKPVYIQMLGDKPKLRQSPAELMLNNLRNIKSLEGLSLFGERKKSFKARDFRIFPASSAHSRRLIKSSTLSRMIQLH